jgi:hypothetical protein
MNHSIRKIIGVILLVFGIFIEALEHVDFVWSRIPEKYSRMIADPKIVAILILAGFVVLLLGRSDKSSDRQATIQPTKPQPNLVLLHCRQSHLQAINRGGVMLSFRNDVLSSNDNAVGLIANISYAGPNGARVEVNYGKWVEGDDFMIVGRGDTKQLLIAVIEGKEVFAVDDIAPQTNFQKHEIVHAGTLIPGAWMLTVTLTAEHFEGEYFCKLTIGEDASVTYAFRKNART